MSLLALSGVYAGYGGGDVLQGVDLEVEDRSVTCIVGPNGAGKSTVLRVVSGLLSPRQGEVSFDGANVGGEDPGKILQLGVVQVAARDVVGHERPIKIGHVHGYFSLW